MLSEKDILAWQEHHKDLLQEADRDRMVRQALAQHQQIRPHQRALAWLGSHLVTWGCRLQRRYTFGALEGQGTASFDSTFAPDGDCVS